MIAQPLKNISSQEGAWCYRRLTALWRRGGKTNMCSESAVCCSLQPRRSCPLWWGGGRLDFHKQGQSTLQTLFVKRLVGWEMKCMPSDILCGGWPCLCSIICLVQRTLEVFLADVQIFSGANKRVNRFDQVLFHQCTHSSSWLLNSLSWGKWWAGILLCHARHTPPTGRRREGKREGGKKGWAKTF